MYVEDVKDGKRTYTHIKYVGDRSSTPKGCNAIYVGDIRDHNNLQYTQYWLKSPKSQLSKTFFGLKIH